MPKSGKPKTSGKKRAERGGMNSGGNTHAARVGPKGSTRGKNSGGTGEAGGNRVRTNSNQGGSLGKRNSG